MGSAVGRRQEAGRMPVSGKVVDCEVENCRPWLPPVRAIMIKPFAKKKKKCKCSVWHGQ